MASRAGIRYLIGNLLAGTDQWGKMYTTGAALTTVLKFSLISLGLYQGLLSGSNNYLSNYIIEVLNCFIPLVAYAFDQPFNAGLTLISNVLLGDLIWTKNFEASTGGR